MRSTVLTLLQFSLLLSQVAIAQQPTATSAPADAPPVTISIDESGNLILSSEDTAALDRLEEIMQANRPPRRPYDIFKVKHTRASWIKLNLDDYFREKDEDDSRSNRYPYYYFYGMQDDSNKDKTRQLGDKPPLRFIADNDTNSIVVQGADDVDRQTIKELIELWDVPEPVDDSAVRYTRLVQVRFSRADTIASTLKEAYRDLLSANDKAFQQQQQGGAGNEEKHSGGGGEVQAGGGMSFSFRGKLSLGVDPVTNSILVSAEGNALLDLVCDMIDKLDVAAQPEGNFEVYHLPPSVNGKSVKEALSALLATPKQQQQGQNPQQAQQNQGQGGEQAGASNSGGRSNSNRSSNGRNSSR